MKRVAIIGAGGGGLCAAKHLLSHIGVVEPPVIYEQSNHVGGTWVYEEITPNCDEPFSSMYENLRTNLPKEVMSFPDMSYPRNLPSFLHHTEIKKYIENYAKKFKLYDHIRFGTKVDHVTSNTGGGWKVTTIENGDKENMETYDSILVCNGHYSKPYYPQIPGLKNHYRNRTTHSHYYRHPDQFSDGPQNTCFVLGIGPSAVDISIELSKRFNQIILSHRSERLATKLPSNVKEAYGLSHIDNDGNFVCQDGTAYSEVDLFLPCTGYEYSFSFLDSKIFKNLVTCEKRLVTNLYKHMFYIPDPTLCFIGIPSTVAPFPFMYQQALYAGRVIAGLDKLPDREAMYQDLEKEQVLSKQLGIDDRHFHKFGSRQFDYLDDLALLSEPGVVEPYIPYLKDMYDYVMEKRRRNVLTYRKDRYHIYKDGASFKVT